MQANIYLNQEELSNKIEQLKIEKENMKTVLEKVNNDALRMCNYWSGDTGNKAYESLNNQTKKYTIIVKEIESYIKFLENIISAYSTMDNFMIRKMEENANIKAV